MVDQAEIHRKVARGDVGERKEAAEQLRDNFADLLDKNAAWEDLIRLTGDGDSDVRQGASNALGSVFPHVPDKDEAWKDLHRLTGDKNSYVRWRAAFVLGSAFQYVPDKDEAWEDLHRLTGDKNSNVRIDVAKALGTAFQHVPDKDTAWKDLIRLAGDEDSNVRLGASNALGSAFQHVPDKDAAWKDLHRLTGDKNSSMRLGAAVALGSAFQFIPDKDAAWKDLHWLTGDKNSNVRLGAANALGIAFQLVPDKDAAWKDLHRLTGDKNSSMRWVAAVALGSAFPHVPNKVAAWEDLHRLTGDENRFVRQGAANALGSAFPHVPNKVAAWEDLHRLTGDENRFVRQGAANALGSAFPHVPNKVVAWEDLHRLTGDEDSNVRVSANHSLGRESIFKATGAESEEGFRKEMKNALEFFERSSKEATYSNPSQFCLPFYRSFYSIAFEKTESVGEVQRYLTEAKRASKGSKNKETLLEAVENLANALSEAHKARDFDVIKSDLNAYRQYCDRAADLIGDAEEGAPGAAGILRRGMPIIGDRIREIQEKAEALCRETRGTGTPYEPLGIEVNKLATKLSDRDDLQNERIASIISDNLGKFCNLLPEGEREYLCKIVEDLSDESEPENKLIYIGMALSYLLPSIKLEIQNSTKLMNDKKRSDEQPSQKNGPKTTVFAGAGSTVVVPHTETESGDVTVTTAVTEESTPEKHRIDQQKRTAIEIFADVAVHVLVYTVLHHYLEELMPVIAPILVLTTVIILLMIIRNAKSR